MTAHSNVGGASQKPAPTIIRLLTPNEAGTILRASLSWLAKSRMRGDGPLTSG
jgi:hypothetical protein